MHGLCGVYNIMATPFTSDGDVDEERLHNLVDATVQMGVDGITVLGVLLAKHRSCSAMSANECSTS